MKKEGEGGEETEAEVVVVFSFLESSPPPHAARIFSISERSTEEDETVDDFGFAVLELVFVFASISCRSSRI